MIKQVDRTCGALFIALITTAVLLALSAPVWAAVGIALVVYLQVINSCQVYNAHWSVRHEGRR